MGIGKSKKVYSVYRRRSVPSVQSSVREKESIRSIPSIRSVPSGKRVYSVMPRGGGASGVGKEEPTADSQQPTANYHFVDTVSEGGYT